MGRIVQQHAEQAAVHQVFRNFVFAILDGNDLAFFDCPQCFLAEFSKRRFIRIVENHNSIAVLKIVSELAAVFHDIRVSFTRADMKRYAIADRE